MNVDLRIEASSPGNRLAAIAPPRLAAPIAGSPAPWPPNEAHQRAHERALDWQGMAGEAQMWEVGPAEENRAYELIGQMASTGEQLALALAAAGEVAAWQHVRKRSDPDALHEMCMRAVAEAQSLFVIGAGHELANVVLRALALDSRLRSELVARFRRRRSSPTFSVFSDAPIDWVSMNRETCGRLRAVARSSGAYEVVDLIEPVAKAGSSRTWKALLDRRGEDFHRWRAQTHGIEGVPRETQWTREGDARVLHIGRLRYEEARGRADETAALATEAMLALAQAMGPFKSQLYVASRRLGGPKFVSK